MKKSALFFAGALSISVSLSKVAQAAPIGMIAHLAGTLSVLGKGGKKVPLRLLSRVEPGATLVSGPASNAILVLFESGARWKIGSNARVDVGPKNVAGAQLLAALSGPSAGAAKMLGEARVGAVLARGIASFERISPGSKGYVTGAAPHFDWMPMDGAARYSFTLFDLADNVIWNTSTDQTGADYPALTPLVEKRPYLWKLTGFSESGKPLIGSRWGIVTPLSEGDARLLDNLSATLLSEAAGATDKSPLLVLVETYRSFGVLNGALELLESEALRGESGALQAKNEILDSLSPFARTLSGRGVKIVASR